MLRVIGSSFSAGMTSEPTYVSDENTTRRTAKESSSDMALAL